MIVLRRVRIRECLLKYLYKFFIVLWKLIEYIGFLGYRKDFIIVKIIEGLLV